MAPHVARPESGALESEPVAVTGRTLLDQFQRNDGSSEISAEALRRRPLLPAIADDAAPQPANESASAPPPPPPPPACLRVVDIPVAGKASTSAPKGAQAAGGLLSTIDLADLDDFLPEPTDTPAMALDKYLRRERKGNKDDRARERFGLVVPFVIALIGDKQVSAITRRDLDKVDMLLPDIPKRKGIPAEQRNSLLGRYLYAKKHGWGGLERLSKTTLHNGYHTTLNTFFDWLHQKSALSEAPHKFAYVQDNNPDPEDRDVFSPDEAIKLASLPLFTGCQSATRIWNPGAFFVQSFLYWGYVIALVTGMRPAEIAQVRCRDLVSIEDEDGVVWFFDFTDSVKDAKTSTSRRMVPLLPLVIELGLVERRDILAAAGYDRLFPEWKPLVKTTGEIKHGHALSKSWQYVKFKFGFTRNGVTLYSARHWFAQRLDEVGQLAERSRHLAMGHATGKSKARLTYGAQSLSLGIARMINSISDPTLAKVSAILLDAKRRADRGELQRIGVIEMVQKGLDATAD